MPRKTKIPDSPRFEFAAQTAYKLLLEFGFNAFPISPDKVLYELKDFVICYKWSEAQQTFDFEDPLHLKQQNAEGRTILSREEGKYIIVYDDVKITNPERITWTIMHEIGHIILGHLTDFEETALYRGGITEDKYGVLEVEANYFASEFLMPTPILRYFTNINSYAIALLFGVSEEAATRQYDRVFKAKYLPHSKYEEKLIRNFYKFIISESKEVVYMNIYDSHGLARDYKYMAICRKCPKCLSYIDDSKAKYCPFCGEEIEHHQEDERGLEHFKKQQDFVNLPGVSHMRYPYVEKKKDSAGTEFAKITICPACLNQEFSTDASYCPICGQPLENRDLRGKRMKMIEDCFNRTTGCETSSNSWYPQFENRYKRIMAYHGSLLQEDWVKYPYWEFTKWLLRKTLSKAYMDLMSSLLYSAAFMDDNDDIYIITDTKKSRDIMEKKQDILISYLKRTDDINRKKVEVLVAYDL